MEEVKKSEPKLDSAVSALQKHIDLRKMRQSGMAPQVYDKTAELGAFIQRPHNRQHHHHSHHKN